MAAMTPLMLEFMRPERLWALAIIPLIAVLYVLLAGRRVQRPMSSRLRVVLPRDAAWKRHGAVLLALLSLGSLIIAWAVPKDYVDQPRDRATIVVALDVSWSMEAEDVEPNRLAAAQAGAKAFIDSLPERFNVALVTFAGTPDIAVPPTIDRGAVARAIDAVQLAPSTAVGEGVYTSLKALTLVAPDPDDPEAVAPAAVVLLSDGATNIGRSSAGAAELAASQEVPVYTIAYGTDNGYVEQDGQRQRVAVDHYELSEIARLSGGKKYAAENSGQLREVYEAIRRSVGTERVPAEVTDRYAGLAIIFAALAALGVISLGARWP
ncbi:magnesium chelatase [Tessaracoccus lapidicaptus]|uniref:Magnesium chelatase n=1 Tax=Tessaracoccus lapidicaptus TaxID=1427523 RepID=A0A1C0AK55_9ACTN|nr:MULTISPECIES: VWA domain-containing protein [Tessaracoccus]AQX17028.1 magnesium chelatase [Tessaracoccus sp. T2.5-30]OCL32994.1 magnesium chelatase [Tessaracoccus lapidicaptus]